MMMFVSVRTTLAIINCTSLLFLTRRVRKIFGRRIEKYTLLITMTQFHLLFYMGRTLPNMFAFPLGKFPSAFHSYLFSKLTKCRTRSSNRHRPPLITSRPENTKRQRPPDRFLPRLRYLDFLSYRHAIRNHRIVSSSGIHGLVVWRKYTHGVSMGRWDSRGGEFR